MSNIHTPIGPGCRVSLHFSLALPDGEEIDSNYSAAPAAFVVGDGSLLPGFEASLLGMTAGEELDTVLPPDQGFGSVNAENIQCFPRSRFAGLLDNEFEPAGVGSVISFRDAGGFELPGVIKTITEGTVEVDFNHPLAGRDIRFRAKIISVLPADTDVLSVKL